MTKIVLKHGAGVPAGSDLEVAEVAIDNVSGAMYTKLADDSVKHLNPEGVTVEWDDVTGKPSSFPPSTHNHNGVYQPVGDYIEDADGSASNDGHEYARKNGGWVKLEDHLYNGHDAVKITGDQSAAGKKTWTDDATFGDVVNFRERVHGDTTANFTTSVSSAAFIKTDGTADQFLMADGSVSGGGVSTNLEGVWAYNASDAEVASFTTRNADWATATTITVHKEDGSGFEHNFALMNEGDVIFIQAPSGGAEYSVVEKTPASDTCAFTVNVVSYYGTFPTAGDESQINFIPQVSLISPGDTAGQVTTWDGAAWTPSSALVIAPDTGNATFTGAVNVSGGGVRRSGRSGFAFGDNYIVPLDNTNSIVSDKVDLGNASEKFKDAHFSGNVYLDADSNAEVHGLAFKATGSEFGSITYQANTGEMKLKSGYNGYGGFITFATNGETRLTIDASGDAKFTGEVDVDTLTFAGYCGLRTTSGTNVVPTDGSGSASDGVVDLGASNDKFKDGYFAGTVDAAGFTINGNPISGGGGGLPAGGYTYGDTITAVDFIATSDERAKVNIKTAPVGLIDSLKGREWDWKESGKKGSGVIAQELEQVLPHLVHEDDDGMKSVAYNGLVAYLIEEVKALRAEVGELKDAVK